MGALHTPRAMASKLAVWGIRSPDDRVLDPSFGGLAFLLAAAARLPALGQGCHGIGRQLYGIDLDPAAMLAAETEEHLALSEDGLVLGDFLPPHPWRSPRFRSRWAIRPTFAIGTSTVRLDALGICLLLASEHDARYERAADPLGRPAPQRTPRRRLRAHSPCPAWHGGTGRRLPPLARADLAPIARLPPATRWI